MMMIIGVVTCHQSKHFKKVFKMNLEHSRFFNCTKIGVVSLLPIKFYNKH
jgi:hypothetical protein